MQVIVSISRACGQWYDGFGSGLGAYQAFVLGYMGNCHKDPRNTELGQSREIQLATTRINKKRFQQVTRRGGVPVTRSRDASTKGNNWPNWHPHQWPSPRQRYIYELSSRVSRSCLLTCWFTPCRSWRYRLTGTPCGDGQLPSKKCVYVFALTQRNGLRASVSQYISLIVKNTYQTVQKPRITEQDTFQYIPLKILPKPSKNMQQTGG